MIEPNEKEHTTETLACPLNPEEILGRATNAAIDSELAHSATETLRNYTKERKAEIEELEERARQGLREVRERVEYRDVECDSVRNEEDRTVETIRTDTGEIIRTRPMSHDERQLGLFPSVVTEFRDDDRQDHDEPGEED